MSPCARHVLSLYYQGKDLQEEVNRHHLSLGDINALNLALTSPRLMHSLNLRLR